VGDAKPVKRNVAGVKKIPCATDYALPLVEEKQMPTLLVGLHVVTSVVVQLPGLDRSVFEINGTAKPLHVREEMVM